MAGAWCADDVREGGVFDGLIFGGEASIVLELVFPPGRNLELFGEQIGVFTDPVQLPA